MTTIMTLISDVSDQPLYVKLALYYTSLVRWLLGACVYVCTYECTYMGKGNSYMLSEYLYKSKGKLIELFPKNLN